MDVVDYCAPGAKNKYGSCYTIELLRQLAKDINKYLIEIGEPISITKSEINTTSYEKLSKNVHNAYRSIIPDGCVGDHCLLLSDVYKDKNKQAFEDVFRPFMPIEWYNSNNDWLSTPHISDSIDQYLNVYKNFKWYGASPQDIFHPSVCSAYDNICNINVKKLLSQGKDKMGMVFNLDDHTQSGSHWVGLFADFTKGGIYYFDSTGRVPQDDSIKLMRKIFNQGNELLLKGEYDIDKSHCVDCNCEYLNENKVRIPNKYERQFVPGSIININGKRYIIDDRDGDVISLSINGHSETKMANGGKGRRKKKNKNKNKNSDDGLYGGNPELTDNYEDLMSLPKKKVPIKLNSFKCFFNQKDHQRKNTECGVYSIHFIINMLEGKHFYDISNNIIRDEQMWMNRVKYFTPTSWDGHMDIMSAVKETSRVLKENNELATV